MAVELLPSVLARTVAQFKRRSQIAEHLAPVLHLDVMDGKFVATTSVSPARLSRRRWNSRIEVHAMVMQPMAIWPLLQLKKLKRVYLHVELGQRLLPMITLLRQRGIEFGLAICPVTPITRLSPYIRSAKSVLVMSVHPGRYQAPFLPASPARIQAVHRRWPDLIVACDGGMNPTTIPAAIQAGAKRIIIGSDVMLNDDPLTEWRRLKKISKGL